MEETPINTPWYLDKSLWLPLLSFVFAILNSKLGINLQAEVIYALLAPVITYIIMNKWKTAMLIKTQITAAAASAGAAATPVKSLNQ